MNIIYIISKVIKKMHIPAIKNSHIDKTSKVCSGSQLLNVKIGRYSYIGNNCIAVNVNIGSFCSVADNCKIGGADHPIKWVSTSPVFHEGKNVLNKHFSQHHFDPYKCISIGSDVWIGANCLIKSGVSIGHGAVIGMGSIVTKDIAPYEIVAGNPAKVIKKRFSDEIIDDLLKLKWWELKDMDLKKCAEDFNKVGLYILKYAEVRENEDIALG